MSAKSNSVVTVCETRNEFLYDIGYHCQNFIFTFLLLLVS